MDPRKPATDNLQGAGALDPRGDSTAEALEAEKEDERLDEELDETFPASDPVPYRHDD